MFPRTLYNASAGATERGWEREKMTHMNPSSLEKGRSPENTSIHPIRFGRGRKSEEKRKEKKKLGCQYYRAKGNQNLNENLTITSKQTARG